MLGPIFVDVDGTMTDGFDKPYNAPGVKIRRDVIERTRKAIESGEVVVLWSARGHAYVERFAQYVGLKPLACVPKPNLFVDDFVDRKGPGFRDAHRMKWAGPSTWVQMEDKG